MTTNDEIRWFVHSQRSEESQQTIECLRGTRMWEKNGSAGCLGDAGDIVALNTWHGVRFVQQSTGDWEITVEDESRESYLVARVKPGGAELAWVETIYQRSSSKNIVGGFWHDLPYFKGPYIQEGRKSQMWMWPPSDPDDYNKLNWVFVNEDKFFKTCDPGEGAEYRPDPTYIQHAIKDEIEPDVHGQWYTGKVFGNPEEFVCFGILW